MLDSHVKFHASSGKRMILVVDDEAINRALLGSVLEEKYEVLYAESGQEALRLLNEHKDDISLVLLDLIMPDMHGFDILKYKKDSPELSEIPAIVMTSDRSAEVESLQLGAMDFIPKPYPQPEVIHARVQRNIELSEDRDIIVSTERDQLTGLYNREYFYRYAQQFDQHHKELEMDAILIDINRFHMINERYGRQYGDLVLQRIGQQLRDYVAENSGIAGRRSADSFLVYCPHSDNYTELLERASAGLSGDENEENRVRLRIGVYAGADRTIDIERRFDRAKSAADTVRGSYSKNIGIYDNALLEKEIYAEQLLEDFRNAIEERQFTVFYQPKYDVRPFRPILDSAEALVRWVHPKLGMISPGVFIPLFEGNGMIEELDHYVWRETARQMREWIDKFGITVPVSVNVSRIDMYNPNLVEGFRQLIQEFDLDPSMFHLEITESAYTQDSVQIVERVNILRREGFHIEMDDFGTGYSSLNMISNLPIDALKLDMQFIRQAFSGAKDTRMVEVIIEIADSLSVPIIAEGVETEEQMHSLKAMGCDIVQGYYFSKPVPAADFERFLLERKQMLEEEAAAAAEREKQAAEAAAAAKKAREEERIRAANQQKEESEPRELKGLSLRTAAYIFITLAFLSGIALLTSDVLVNRGYQGMARASERYISAQGAAFDMEIASDYLTDRVRCFVENGDAQYMNDFYEEINVTKRRDAALEELNTLLENYNGNAYQYLAQALKLSNELVVRENLAMRLMVRAGHYDDSEVPAEIMEIAIPEEYEGLGFSELKRAARSLVFDDEYMKYKEQIKTNVGKCTDELLSYSAEQLNSASRYMYRLLTVQSVLTVLLLTLITIYVVFISSQVRKPLTKMVERMRSRREVPVKGASEIRFVTETYNQMFKENQKVHEQLTYDASHDALTGLYNRSAYEILLQGADQNHIALLIIDIDKFKAVNDQYGHDMGDRVLCRVAEVLKMSFRSVDFICRIGGDEFVVIMTRADSSLRKLVLNKVEHANVVLQHPKDDLPPVSLSVGVAFADRKNPQGDIFKDADTALYRVKEAGRCGCAIF